MVAPETLPFGKGVISSTVWGVVFSLTEGSLGEVFDYYALSAIPMHYRLFRRFV